MISGIYAPACPTMSGLLSFRPSKLRSSSTKNTGWERSVHRDHMQGALVMRERKGDGEGNFATRTKSEAMSRTTEHRRMTMDFVGKFFSPEQYLKRCDDGTLQRSTCGYHAAWISPSGTIYAVEHHTKLMGDYKKAFQARFVRLLVDIGPGLSVEVIGTMTDAQYETLSRIAHNRDWGNTYGADHYRDVDRAYRIGGGYWYNDRTGRDAMLKAIRP
jgi:hypothetical protein